MPAWEVKNAWNEGMIGAYRTYVASSGPSRVGSSRATCEDLALRMVTNFAAANELPVIFKNNAHSKGLNPAQFATKERFLDVVLTSTGASDLITYQTVKLVPGAQIGQASFSLPKARPGDLIILYPGGHHVQVITSAQADKVTLVQGNFRPRSERCNRIYRAVLGENQNFHGSSCYIGAMVREQSYEHTGSPPTWKYSGGDPDVFSDEGRLCIWDFAEWNHLVPNNQPAAAGAAR